METMSRHMVRHAQQLAHEIDARAVVVYADAVRHDDELRQLLSGVEFPAILVTRTKETVPHGLENLPWISVPNVHLSRAGQVKTALLVCLAKGLLHKGDRVVCLTGVDGSGSIDMLLVLNLGADPELFSVLDSVRFGDDVAPEVFERALVLATQLAVEGREGRPVGTLFVLGDSERVLVQSRSWC